MSTSKEWQLERESAERYERVVVPSILGPFARALVEHSDLQGGEAVLDIGCGTGAATHGLRQRTLALRGAW
jgi:ubiquinone/menaquinone biosynthesis C-methylase UbiE